MSDSDSAILSPKLCGISSILCKENSSSPTLFIKINHSTSCHLFLFSFPRPLVSLHASHFHLPFFSRMSASTPHAPFCCLPSARPGFSLFIPAPVLETFTFSRDVPWSDGKPTEWDQHWLSGHRAPRIALPGFWLPCASVFCLRGGAVCPVRLGRESLSRHSSGGVNICDGKPSSPCRAHGALRDGCSFMAMALKVADLASPIGSSASCF